MTDVGQFAGRFHPLLVHFPIAFLVLAGLLEVVVWRRLRAGRDAGWPAAAVTPLLALGAAGAVAAATAGYLLGTGGGYAGDTYDRHLALGIGVALLALVTTGAARLRRGYPKPWLMASRVLLGVTLAVLIVTGHLGATLTHGDGYLTEHAPAPVRALLARMSGQPDGPAGPVPPDRAVIYRTVVDPILRTHCVACHGPDKTQGGLRLDAPERLRAGGDHGPVLTPGRAGASELIRRIWLPVGHADAMPPKGGRPISPADAAALRWWVDAGASFDLTLADADVPPEVVPALETFVGPISRGGPTLPASTLAAPEGTILDGIRARGLAIDPVATGSPFVQVHATARAAGAVDERLASLTPVAAHVLWLDLAGSDLTDAAFATIGRFSNLTRLNVSRTAASDAGLAQLPPLAQLEYLNLYGTRVTDAGLARLSSFPRLRRLYLWNTAVTPAGVQQLRGALPRLEVTLDTAAPDVPDLPAQTDAPAAPAAR